MNKFQQVIKKNIESNWLTLAQADALEAMFDVETGNMDTIPTVYHAAMLELMREAQA